MKKYALFAGCAYYPRGGMWDFRGFFDTTNLAREDLPTRKHTKEESFIDEYDWYQIINAETFEVVEAKGDSVCGEPDVFNCNKK